MIWVINNFIQFELEPPPTPLTGHPISPRAWHFGSGESRVQTVLEAGSTSQLHRTSSQELFQLVHLTSTWNYPSWSLLQLLEWYSVPEQRPLALSANHSEASLADDFSPLSYLPDYTELREENSFLLEYLFDVSSHFGVWPHCDCLI